MKFIIEPSAASGMIRLPLKKEMKVPSLWEIMVSKYFSVKYINIKALKHQILEKNYFPLTSLTH